jgi:hypothetical protein
MVVAIDANMRCYTKQLTKIVKNISDTLEGRNVLPKFTHHEVSRSFPSLAREVVVC